MLTGDERERYNRQIIIKGFGEKGQERLKKARVFVAGVGGLGSLAACAHHCRGLG
jgi:molybdopterin/thiamine biosynthesis adenylyltransferase